MIVRDLLKQDIDIDVYDDVCEELGVAFCGPMEMTPEGEQVWGDVLDYEVHLNRSGAYIIAIVHVGGAPDWEHRLERAKEFFWSIAGYCPCDEYNKWFREVE